MDSTLKEVFDTAVWFFAFFGFIVTFTLAWIGFKMVYLAIGFSIQYSYSEYQARKLRNATLATKMKLGPKLDEDEPLVSDEPPEDAVKKPEAKNKD